MTTEKYAFRCRHSTYNHTDLLGLHLYCRPRRRALRKDAICTLCRDFDPHRKDAT